MTIEKQIEAMERMMESCFAYGGIEKDAYNVIKYLMPYKEKLGEDVFNATYERKAKEFESYKVITDTYTDSEGLSYNTIIKK